MPTAVITGASSGIGRAMALALCRAGYEVHAVARNAAALHALRSENLAIHAHALDITDRPAVEAAIAGLPVDVLVNNAGMMPPLISFADMTPADMDATVATNLIATLFLTRLVVPGMRARGSGHIVFTGSSAGHAPFPNLAVYSATKAALSGFAAALRTDLTAHGVRVTEIVPGRVETELYKDVLSPEVRRAMYANNVAVQPDDVAAMLLAVLALPAWADVTRFDIMPTRPTSPSGNK